MGPTPTPEVDNLRTYLKILHNYKALQRYHLQKNSIYILHDAKEIFKCSLVQRLTVPKCLQCPFHISVSKDMMMNDRICETF